MSGISKSIQDVYQRFSRSRWSVVLVIGALFAAIAFLPKKPPQHSASVFAVPKRWAPFSWPEVGVRAEMPEGPTLNHIRAPVLDQELPMTVYASTADLTTYMISYADYPPDIPLPQNDDELLAKARGMAGFECDQQRCDGDGGRFGRPDRPCREPCFRCRCR